VPGDDLTFDVLDPGLQVGHGRPAWRTRGARQGRHPVILLVGDDGEQLADIAQPLGGDDTEVGEVSAQSIAQHRPLPNQQIPGPMQHQHGLLLGALDPLSPRT
jgi:hypothetical protein